MKNLFKALAAFQQECPILIKETGAAEKNYKYVSEADMIETIKPLLKKHNLGYSQPPFGKAVKTIVFEIDSGELIEGVLDIPQDVQLEGMNDFQSLGSAITYLKRYSLAMILGIVSEKDSDAAGRQRRDAKLPEGASLVAATNGALPASNATQVTNGGARRPSRQATEVPPSFNSEAFSQFKPIIQKYLDQGMSHEIVFQKLRQKFIMIEPAAEKMISEMSKTETNAIA